MNKKMVPAYADTIFYKLLLQYLQTYILHAQVYLEPKPNLFNAEKIALTEALVILLETPTP